MNKIMGYRCNLPMWLTVLDADNVIISHAIDVVKRFTKNLKTVEDDDISKIVTEKAFVNSPYFRTVEVVDFDKETNILTFEAVPQDDLYYKVLSEISGSNITDAGSVVSYVLGMQKAKSMYEKLSPAITEMEETGYGIVVPAGETYELQEPKIYQNGKNFGIKLTAHARSVHLVRVDIKSEVSPIIGGQAQSEEMLKFLSAEYANNKNTVWETPIFGRTLRSIVADDIDTKAKNLPNIAKQKMQKTISKITNDAKGGLICITL